MKVALLRVQLVMFCPQINVRATLHTHDTENSAKCRALMTWCCGVVLASRCVPNVRRGLVVLTRSQGKLVANHLSKTYPDTLRWAFAGRNKAKLEAMHTELK